MSEFCNFYFWQKHPYFELFENEAIRHIQTAIRHMWQVANGLDNAGLKTYSDNKKTYPIIMIKGQKKDIRMLMISWPWTQLWKSTQMLSNSFLNSLVRKLFKLIPFSDFKTAFLEMSYIFYCWYKKVPKKFVNHFLEFNLNLTIMMSCDCWKLVATSHLSMQFMLLNGWLI